MIDKTRENMEMADAPADDDSLEFCQRFWRKYKCLLTIIAVVLLILVIGIGIKIGVQKQIKPSDKANYSNVVSADLSPFYKGIIRDGVEPCENFYHYACSNLVEKYKEENMAKHDTMDNMKNQALDFLYELVSRKIVESESVVLNKIQKFYHTCIDSSKVVESKKPLLRLVEDLGGWPILGGGNKKKSNSWVETVRRINFAGIESMFPFHMEVDVDPEDSTKLAIVRFGWSNVGTLRYVHTLPETEPAIDYIEQVANTLGSKNPRVFSDAADCFVFGSRLFGITNPPQTSSHGYFIRYSVAELSVKHPEILWRNLFDSAFTMTNLKITYSDTVILEDPSYISRVSFLLNDTITDTIINYIVWTVLNSTIDFSHLEPRKAGPGDPDFQSRNVSISRNRTCYEVLFDKVGFAMGLVYLQNSFNPLIKEEVLTIFNNIETQASAYLDELHWMNFKIKKNLVGSLTKVKLNQVLPDSDLIDYVNKLVEDWDIQFNSTLENYRYLLGFGRRTKFERLRMSPNKYEEITFLELSTASDASYALSSNTIHISGNLLQKPLFDLSQPKYLSYGSVGFLIGHELTHGLEILFACNNKTCPSYDEFNKRKGCMENLYNNYLLKQVNQKVNGSRTMGENIADIIGLKLAYRAYDHWLANHEVAEPVLHGLNYTARELFWVNAAMVLCTYQEAKQLIETVENGIHSPAEARINVAFGTIHEFVRDYYCSIGSNMKSGEKCDTF